jgi:endonuclease III-like uncharacterized protein
MSKTKMVWAALALFSLGTMIMQQVKIVKQSRQINILQSMVATQNGNISSQHESINRLQEQNISLQDDLNSCEESAIQLKFNR